jgi:hypothetical protein
LLRNDGGDSVHESDGVASGNIETCDTELLHDELEREHNAALKQRGSL